MGCHSFAFASQFVADLELGCGVFMKCVCGIAEVG